MARKAYMLCFSFLSFALFGYMVSVHDVLQQKGRQAPTSEDSLCARNDTATKTNEDVEGNGIRRMCGRMFDYFQYVYLGHNAKAYGKGGV